MKKRFVISALFALSLAACSAPQSLQPTDSSQTDGNPSVAEEVNAVDNTPATTDQNLQATAVAWTGTKFAFNDPKEVEYGAGVTSDSSGNVIAVGSSYGFNGLLNYYPDLSLLVHQQNLVITKFNAAGAITWKRMIGSSAQGAFKTSGFNLQDRPTVPAGVVADPSGNLYVSGTVAGARVDGSNSGNQNAFLIKFNSSGNIVWSRVLGGAGDDGVSGMAINGTNIYLTGSACGNGLNFAGNTIRGACDVFVTKHDSSGNRLWAKLYGSSGNDFSAKISKVGSGGAVVVGTNQGVLNANNKNGFVVRLDSRGNTIWTRTIATPQNDDALAVTASSDAVYVGGQTNGNVNGVARSRAGTNSSDAFLVKFSLAAGATQWTRYVASTEFGAEFASARVTDLALNSSGQLFVFGTGFNRYLEDTDVAWPVRYDTAGTRTADAGVSGYATPDARGSNAKVAMGLGADGVFLVLDDYLTKTPSSPQPKFSVYVTKLGFDLKQK